jgi:hypothetical protein
MAVVSASPAEEKRRERACTRERGEDRGERKVAGGGLIPSRELGSGGHLCAGSTTSVRTRSCFQWNEEDKNIL